MPPALDRLLASPSALRLLRSLVHAKESPTAYLTETSTKCRTCTTPRRDFHLNRRKTPLVRFKPPNRHETPPWTLPIGPEFNNEAIVVSLAEHLQQRERVEGWKGIRDVWVACREFDLPTSETPDAEFLWATFIKVPDLVVPVIAHAQDLLNKTGHTYPHLYELCMARWLPRENNINQALHYHHQCLLRLKLRKLPLRRLANLGKQFFTMKQYDAFMDMYRTSNERNVYDEVVPALTARGLFTMAQHWHTLCTNRGDLPSQKVASEPAIQKLTAAIANNSDPEARLVYIYAHSRNQQEPKLDAQLVRRHQGRDSAPVRFDDSFCARMFATRSFSPDAIIKGLIMVGVNEIGPQAVRAMATNTNPISELPTRFEELKAAGIALQGSVFSLALERFASEKRWMLVRSILESDQHPDVYDDMAVQKTLLDYYVQQQDLKQIHRTLAILSLFHNDMSTESWNLLLQAQIKLFDPSRILEILQNMREKDIYVSEETLMMIKGILRPRQRGHNPGRSPRGRFDDLRFVARVFFMILEGGIGHIHPSKWSEILRRYGMSNRFRELRRTVLRLFCWYAPQNESRFASIPRSPFLNIVTEKLRAQRPRDSKFAYYDLPAFVTQKFRVHPLRFLFPPSFQQGLVVWGFRQGLLPNAPTEQSMFSPIPAKKHYRHRFQRSGILRRLDWSVGLKHLVELRDLGLQIHPHTVVKALQAMFINLFGRRRSNVIENRKMHRANTIPYVEFVREVNNIWGAPLFREPQLYGKSRLHALMWHPRFARETRQSTYFSLDEVLGPGWRDENAATGELSEAGRAAARPGSTEHSNQEHSVVRRVLNSTGIHSQQQETDQSTSSGLQGLEIAPAKEHFHPSTRQFVSPTGIPPQLAFVPSPQDEGIERLNEPPKEVAHTNVPAQSGEVGSSSMQELEKAVAAERPRGRRSRRR
jgi:hypothetical protein